MKPMRTAQKECQGKQTGKNEKFRECTRNKHNAKKKGSAE